MASSPKYPATTAYKQWVWREIRKRSGVERGDGAGALQWLLDRMKRVAKRELMAIGKYETISTGALSQLLGSEEDKAPPPSNSVLLPAINKALDLAPPPVCDPDDDLSQVVDRFREAWAMATSEEKALLSAWLAKRKHDEDSTDGADARETPSQSRRS